MRIGFLCENYRQHAYTVVYSSKNTLNATIQRFVWFAEMFSINAPTGLSPVPIYATIDIIYFVMN